MSATEARRTERGTAGSPNPAKGSCRECRQPSAPGHTRCRRHLDLHRRRTREGRKRKRAENFTADTREALLGLLRAGQPLVSACADLDVPVARVHAAGHGDVRWSADLDAALMEGRNPAIRHGTTYAYKVKGCRCPECRRVKYRERGPRRKGSPPPQPTSTTVASAPAPEVNLGGFLDVRDAVVAAYLAEGSPDRALSLHGATTAWLKRERRSDVAFARRIDQAKEAWATRRGKERAAVATVKAPKPRKERATESEPERAAQVTGLRADLERLLPLVRQGTTLRDARRQLQFSAHRLEKIRRRVPEAEQQLRDAYMAGAGVRKARTAERLKQALDGEPEAQATRLFVAGLAAGRPLVEACRGAGTTPMWIQQRYLRNTEFKGVVDAVLPLRPDLDFSAWIEAQRRLDGISPRRPRPRSAEAAVARSPLDATDAAAGGFRPEH
ncbi:hypothetical protein [Streptomyces umbrinus]|uniref:hypothetical protein n=1 Tax=Streptomyces umbrinus TaxID=67370 RepID=UPI0033C85D67